MNRARSLNVRKQECNQNVIRKNNKMQKYFYLCFIDYAYTFDNVRRKKLLKTIDKLDIFENHSSKTVAYGQKLYSGNIQKYKGM